MTEKTPTPAEIAPTAETPVSAERALRSFRYVVASVSEDALAIWEELWSELAPGVTPSGLIAAEMEEGFKPAGGWPAFLEKFHRLRHYVEYLDKSSKDTA